MLPCILETLHHKFGITLSTFALLIIMVQSTYLDSSISIQYLLNIKRYIILKTNVAVPKKELCGRGPVGRCFWSTGITSKNKFSRVRVNIITKILLDNYCME